MASLCRADEGEVIPADQFMEILVERFFHTQQHYEAVAT